MTGASAKFEFLLTEGAEQYLEAIHDYISEFDYVAKIDKLRTAIDAIVAEIQGDAA